MSLLYTAGMTRYRDWDSCDHFWEPLATPLPRLGQVGLVPISRQLVEKPFLCVVSDENMSSWEAFLALLVLLVLFGRQLLA